MAEGICELCGNWEELERHHVFQGALRDKAEKYKLTVMLCRGCHQDDADSAHRCYQTRVLLRREAQRKTMEKLGWTKARWVEEFGRNYLDEDELDQDGHLIREVVVVSPATFQVLEEAEELPWG